MGTTKDAPSSALRSTVTVQPLAPEDISGLCALYVAAFTDNAAYRYVFPEGDDALLWLFEARVRMLLACGSMYLVAKEDGGGAVVGGVACVPAASKPGVLTMLRHGLGLWPFLWGFGSLARALEIDAEMGYRLADGPKWDASVALMAVRPGMQGRGIGSQLMTALLRQCDEAAWTTVGLDTQEEKNLVFYGRVGFQTTRQSPMKGFITWTMVKRPATGDAAIDDGTEQDER